MRFINLKFSIIFYGSIYLFTLFIQHILYLDDLVYISFLSSLV